MTDITTPPDPAAAGETLRFSHSIRPRAFLGLSLRNGLLNLVTLTLYRFWGKTEVRRRVWRGVRMNDEPFEYTGRGVELFIGFLLALAVLGLPFLLVVFGVQFMGPLVALLVVPILYLFVFWLWGFGVFTAFRYMASRSTWRGIRFRLRGPATGYAWKNLGYTVLNGVTWGWFWPTARRNLAEAVWSEMRYGDMRFRFSAGRCRDVGVYGPFAIGWTFSLVGYFAFSFVLMAIAFASGRFAEGATPPTDLEIMAVTYGLLALLYPFIALIWAPYQAAILRSITAGISLGEARFRLDVKALPIWWLTVSNIFLIVVSLGFLMPFVQARTTRFVVERITSTGEVNLDDVHQVSTGPGSGEGLADAFGFSAI